MARGSWGVHKTSLVCLFCIVAFSPRYALEVSLIANAGVLLSDGDNSLVIDLPYRPGAYGYAEYDPSSIHPSGSVTAVITHEHLDHFDPELFLQTDWSIVGSNQVTDGLPAQRVINGDSIQVGRYTVVALPSEHIPGHRSYRIRWKGRVLFFSGDAQNPDVLSGQPDFDVAFITPWLGCALSESNTEFEAARLIEYHRDGSDDFCLPVENLVRGDAFRLASE